MSWDETGSHLALSDAEGCLELWRADDHLLSQWKCLAREKVPRETFIRAKFAYRGRKVRNTFAACGVSYRILSHLPSGAP